MRVCFLIYRACLSPACSTYISLCAHAFTCLFVRRLGARVHVHGCVHLPRCDAPGATHCPFFSRPCFVALAKQRRVRSRGQLSENRKGNGCGQPLPPGVHQIRGALPHTGYRRPSEHGTMASLQATAQRRAAQTKKNEKKTMKARTLRSVAVSFYTGFTQ